MKKSLILLSTAMILSLAACGEHTHTFASEWTHDETNHWHAATCEHTNEKSGLAAHTIGADGKCTVCDYTIPKDNKVTKDEWVAAFDTNKPFYIADNYKIDMETISEDETKVASAFRSLSVDGLKARKVRSKDALELDAEYSLKTQNGYSSYLWNKYKEKWEINEDGSNPANEFASFLTPFGTNFDKFSYDEDSKSYKCATLSVGGTIVNNMTIKFEDKKIVSASLDSAWKVNEDLVNYHWQSAVTYSGQTVTLPEVDLYEVTEEQYNNAFGSILDNAYYHLIESNDTSTYEMNYEVDGNKEKVNSNGYIYYISKENGQYYKYRNNGINWTKELDPNQLISDEVKVGAGLYHEFTYDPVSHTYKCDSYSSVISGRRIDLTDLEAKFYEGKLIQFDYIITFEKTSTYTQHLTISQYGEMNVELPEVIG